MEKKKQKYITKIIIKEVNPKKMMKIMGLLNQVQAMKIKIVVKIRKKI